MKEEAEKIKLNKNGNKSISDMSILERLLEKDEKVAFAMIFDLLNAGVDTVRYTFNFQTHLPNAGFDFLIFISEFFENV